MEEKKYKYVINKFKVTPIGYDFEGSFGEYLKKMHMENHSLFQTERAANECFEECKKIRKKYIAIDDQYLQEELNPQPTQDDYRDESYVVSDCCGAEPRSNGDSDTQDYGICPDCGEHCEYVHPSEEGDG